MQPLHPLQRARNCALERPIRGTYLQAQSGQGSGVAKSKKGRRGKRQPLKKAESESDADTLTASQPARWQVRS